MNDIIQINNIGVELSTKENRVFTNTRDIAEVFGKRHADVLKTVESKLELFRERNFSLSEYKVQGNNKTYKSYDIDKDFTAFIIMGFVGEKADKFKIAFIDAFNSMETQLISSHNQLTSLQLKAKDDLIAQLTKTTRSFKRVVKDGTTFMSAEGIASAETFTAKGFREFMKSLKLVNRVPKLTHYWELTETGKDSGLVTTAGAHAAPYFDIDKCVELYQQELNTPKVL
jgi:Rha family phage regulatory protein